MGVAHTVDDLQAAMRTDDPVARATRTQLHPSLHLGAGLRIGLGEAVDLGLGVADVSFIETFHSVELQVRRHFTPLVEVACSFPSPRGGRGSVELPE